jgi:hypothetical protein
MVDLKEKKNEASRKDENFQLQLAQDKIKLDIAKIDLIDRQTKSIDLKIKTILRLIVSPALISTGGYLCFASDSLFAPILLFLGLLLAISNEDPLKIISNDSISVVESIQKIDRNSDFKARIVQALKAGSKLALDEYLSNNPSIKILEAAIKGWIEETEN